MSIGASKSYLIKSIYSLILNKFKCYLLVGETIQKVMHSLFFYEESQRKL